MIRASRWVFTPMALRDFRRLDQITQRRVQRALDRLVGVPSQGDVRRLEGTDDEWRLRVGDWRVRFFPDEAVGTVVVLRILHRREAYRN